MATNFANGVSSYGMPIFPSNFPFINAQSAAASVGNGQAQKGASNVYFVSSVLGSDGNPGTKMASGGPLKTFKQALTLVSPGDTIVILPGHVETMVAAGTVSCATSNITVIGLGVGATRPTFKYATLSSATFDIVVDNVTFTNIRWDATALTLTKAINVKTAANDVTFDTCEFLQSGASFACATMILTDASANNLRINNCRFTITGAGTAVTNALNVVGGDGLQVTNSFFEAGYATGSGAIQNVTTACTNAIVLGNTINNLTASCTKALVFVSTSTGVISKNSFQILSGTAPITGAAMSWVGPNYYAATIGTGSVLV